MGTNYYGVQISKIKEIADQQTEIYNEIKEKDNSVELLNIVHEYFKNKIDSLKKIHIGKSSAGWDFLFQLNDKKYYHDKESLIEWLKTVQIIDEYGRELSFEEFWNDVVSDRTWNGKPTKKSRDSVHSRRYIVIDDLEFLDCEFS